MDNEHFLPCKSCGKPLDYSAISCPQCGNTSPFCFNIEDIQLRGKADGKRINNFLKIAVFAALALAIASYFMFHIWWLSILLFFVVGGALYMLRYKMEEKADDQFLKDMKNDYEMCYKGTHHYDLSEDQYSLWEHRLFMIYSAARNKNIDD